MTSARSAHAAPRRDRVERERPRPRPREVPARSPRRRVRWNRIGRISLLIVLTVVAALYIEHAVTYLITRAKADREQAVVRRLTEANAALAQQAKSLGDPATIERDARALGMVRAGERPYVVTGLPDR